MSDEKTETEATTTPEEESVFTVDWRREPLPIYANAASIDFGPDAVGIVFLDAAASEHRVTTVNGKRRMVAVPVNSIRMTHPNFLHFLRALNEKWNEFADGLKVAPGSERPPKFELVRGDKEP